jgi:hypothetical protein
LVPLLLQSPKKFQEILKHTGSPIRKQPHMSPAGRRSPLEVLVRSIRQYGQIGAATIALMFMAGWGFSLMVSTRAASVDSRSAIGMKPALVGSYSVNGTDADGVPYSASQIVDIYLAPSGALELDWNNGGKVGVGQVIDDVLAVASTTKGRTVILLMNINADGSLSGR